VRVEKVKKSMQGDRKMGGTLSSTFTHKSSLASGNGMRRARLDLINARRERSGGTESDVFFSERCRRTDCKVTRGKRVEAAI